MHCVLVATKKSSANKDRQGIKKYKVGKLKKVDNNWHMWFMFVSTFKVCATRDTRFHGAEQTKNRVVAANPKNFDLQLWIPL